SQNSAVDFADNSNCMQLGFGIRFSDLYERDGLLRVDAAFLAFLKEIDGALAERLAAARSQPPSGKPESDLLVALAPHVEDFLAKLFRIETEAQALAARHHDFARQVTAWLQDESSNQENLERAARYAAWATLTPQGKAKHRRGVLFKTPHKLDYLRLIPVHTENRDGYQANSLSELRRREGFALTDAGTDLVGALDQANYCIWCHEQGKDSCSKGLREKAPAEGFRKTVFGVPLAGCPLEEKISEFHLVKARGE